MKSFRFFIGVALLLSCIASAVLELTILIAQLALLVWGHTVDEWILMVAVLNLPLVVFFILSLVLKKSFIDVIKWTIG